MKHNTIEISLKVFYTSINGFLPHVISSPSIHATFELKNRKKYRKCPQGLCSKCLKPMQETLSSLS